MLIEFFETKEKRNRIFFCFFVDCQEAIEKLFNQRKLKDLIKNSVFSVAFVEALDYLMIKRTKKNYANIFYHSDDSNLQATKRKCAQLNVNFISKNFCFLHNYLGFQVEKIQKRKFLEA